MLRSLFTGISGLRAHQQMLDVTANNIANVNTVGYKSGATSFEETLSQTLGGASAATATAGGTNPIQVGLGVKLAATSANLTEGSAQTTGNKTDLMINGDGYFVIKNAGTTEYTRAGAFHLDAVGHLVTPDGSILQDVTGADVDLSALQVPGAYKDWSIGPNGDVNAVNAAGVTTTLATIGLATFANPAGLTRVGDTAFVASASSGVATVVAPATVGIGNLSTGLLEMSNVDLSTELTNLMISERGFQANSRVISTSDEVLQTLVNLKN
ncbi:MAG TPA: flagellar hook-basal body complex protein [Mycobacterium sp.]|nr:flagellar hook-basal body complex protein [Mycobacterium sp.]